MPNAGAKKKPSVIRDKVVWKEKVHFDCRDYFGTITLKVDQKGVAPKTPYFARGRRNVTMVYNKTRFASPSLKNFMVNLGLV